MRLLLAPMEGLLDYTLRDVLTRVGGGDVQGGVGGGLDGGRGGSAAGGAGVDRCVSEFIRITDMLLPHRVFTRIVPELHHGSRTPSGVLVRPQLLGSDPTCLAENAARLAELNPAGIDLNFGCPAKTVNHHRGGAILLDEPELLHAIAQAVRRAVPAHIPVSAKMRLGYLDASRAVECAQALASGGAAELVVHARTKADGYRPPAYWELIRPVRDAVAIPVIANGEIWTAADALRCQEVSGCQDLMLGRGIVADPGLALAIRGATKPVPWADMVPLLTHYWTLIATHVAPRHRAGRLKQWLNLLRRRYPEAQVAFDSLRTLNAPGDVDRWLLVAGRGDGQW
jgi:tRNA-dihydrouridine synthase C